MHRVVLLAAAALLTCCTLGRVQAQAARFTDTAALFQALVGGWWNRDPATADNGARLRCRPPAAPLTSMRR